MGRVWVCLVTAGTLCSDFEGTTDHHRHLSINWGKEGYPIYLPSSFSSSSDKQIYLIGLSDRSPEGVNSLPSLEVQILIVDIDISSGIGGLGAEDLCFIIKPTFFNRESGFLIRKSGFFKIGNQDSG